MVLWAYSYCRKSYFRYSVSNNGMPLKSELGVNQHTHTNYFFNCTIPFFQDCIVLGQTKSFHILLGTGTIPPCLTGFFCFHRCIMFNPVYQPCYTCPNLLKLPFFITKLTGSSPISSLNSVLFSFELN